MSTTWFYAPTIAQDWLLPVEEARHCLKVLRHQVGDEIEVFDGYGNLYTVRLASQDPKHCLVSLVKQERIQETPELEIHLAVAPTKNSSRTEWLLEKATEIGVEAVHFIKTAHSERTIIKLDRLDRVVVSAMKQSRKARKPLLHPLTPFSDWVSTCHFDQRFIAHLSKEAEPLGRKVQVKGSVVVMVGPEGDFSTEEIALAQQNGFQPVTLSPYRLRTETAAIVAVEQCNFVYQMKGKL